MALTSIRNEPCRIKKELQQMTDIGRYRLTEPGPGSNVGFCADPNIRLQKWGANLRTNTINTESDLLGLTRTLNQDNISLNNYQDMRVTNEKLNYEVIEGNTQETRTENPAWNLLDQTNNRWGHFVNSDDINHMHNTSLLYTETSSRLDQKNNYNKCHKY